VVGVVVAAAATVGSPPALAASVASVVRHGICLVAGGVCTAREARAAGLPPCLLHARLDRERLGARVLVVRVGRSDALVVERRSDGSASVSFADGESAGAGAAVGLRLPTGPNIGIRGGGGLQFTAGRTWEFPTFDAAARFVRRWAPRESLGGEAKGVLRSVWPFSRGHRPPAMPAPDASYVEGGPYAEFAASLRGVGPRGAGLGGEEEGELGAVVGRRIGRGGRVTWYDRLDEEAAGRLGAILGAVESRSAGQASLEVTEVHGHPLELRVRAAARVYGDLDLSGPASALGDLAARLRGAPVARPGGTGRRLEAEVSLDLTDPRNLRALHGVVEVLRLRVPPADWGARLRALAERLDAAGAVDVRLLRVGIAERDLGTEAALGLGVGGSYRRTQEVRDLLRAWSLRAGGALQEREDCVAA
jgi:hypothetical protein